MAEQSKSDLLLAESISALMDNEASELEIARIMKSKDTEKVARTWSSYQLASAAMRRDLPADFSSDTSLSFADRVSASIDEEPSHKALQGKKTLSGMWVGLSKMAVAASVAGAVVIGMQSFNQEGAAGQDVIANASPTIEAADVSIPIGFNAPALTARAVSAQYGAAPTRQVVFEPRQAASVKVSNEQIRAYLDRLVGYHTDHAAINSAQGMLPYARMPITPQPHINE